jgi:hypothetical protein
MTDALSRGRGNLEGLKQSILSAINISSNPNTLLASRESIRKHFGRFIADHRSLIPLGVGEIGSSFRTFSLRKVFIPNNTSK